jgi:anthranilate phosphoribosyltransferase
VSVREALATVVGGHDLTRAQAHEAMASLVAGDATPVQIGAFAVALRMKGETPDEIAGLAEVMRDAATRVDAGPDAIDVVGTGGDGAGTFNISTLSSLVVASAGGHVAKHGNRGISSACGAADYLEAIGVAIDLPPEGVASCIQETGFGFMFAPLYHPAMRHAMLPRREIGVRTFFNILGPLTNPARTRRQLTGVAVESLGASIASVHMLLGLEHALVVHGADGLDELSISGPTVVHEARAGEVATYIVEPETFGLRRAPVGSVQGGTVDANRKLADCVLAGEAGPARDVVLLNAGAALYVAGLASSIAAGVTAAADAIDSGRAAAKLRQVVDVSQRARARHLAGAA